MGSKLSSPYLSVYTLPMSNDSTVHDISVLIIAYRRFDNIEKIVNVCLKAGIRDFYFHIDVPKNSNEEARIDNQKVVTVISELEKHLNFNSHIFLEPENRGCAVSVVSGIDWAFTNCHQLIILEDDCIPSPAFFEFCFQGFRALSSNPRLHLICGTQFAPKVATGDNPVLSKYALTWGWATTWTKWQELRKSFMQSQLTLIERQLTAITPERSFWSAGARRAMGGYIDAWDLVIGDFLYRNDYLALLPPRNLIMNIGDDSVAEHVEVNSQWTRLPIEERLKHWTNSEENIACDLWLKKNFYKIRIKHVFSTKINLFIDLLFSSRKIFSVPLKERLR